jgi:hypothetical protein
MVVGWLLVVRAYTSYYSLFDLHFTDSHGRLDRGFGCDSLSITVEKLGSIVTVSLLSVNMT